MLNYPKLRDPRYQEVLVKYVERIIENNRVLGIVLYGSMARGMEKPYPESDIDLLIIAENLHANPCYRRLEVLKYKEDLPFIEDLWLTPKELIDAIKGGWGVILDALADGVVIYDKEGIIEKARQLLQKLHARIGRVWRLKRG